MDYLQDDDQTQLPLASPEPPGWQRHQAGFLDRGRFLMENEVLSDVVFVVGKGVIKQEIPAHKFILAMGSPVFETLFYGPIRQLAADGSDLRIPDIEPDSFRNLLRYLYTDDVTGINEDTVLSTLHAAKKYDVPQLKNACLQFMKQNIRCDNVFAVLEQAQSTEETDLIAQCLELIDHEALAIANSNEFLDINFETLLLIFERSTLAIKEIDLFNALDRWATNECNRRGFPVETPNKRRIIGKAIYEIRFPLMSVEELANGPVQSGILRPEEVKDIFLYLFAEDKPEIAFSAVPRLPANKSGPYTVERFAEAGGSWGYGGGADSIQFVSDHDVRLQGCGIYGTSDGPGRHVINLKVLKADDKKVLREQETVIVSDGSRSPYRIPLTEPIIVKSGVPHIVTARIEGPSSFRGAKGAKKVAVKVEKFHTMSSTPSQSQYEFSFTESPFSENGTSVQDGQLPLLIFSPI
ncbi:BTB/POZ domain-containing protein 2-like isoform X2 [Paramacrobiotus metropolitanus]|nr:BTB/POZ domain-containing protein 2-like isoform X2 [Paramacrobiotus metropolitanus]